MMRFSYLTVPTVTACLLLAACSNPDSGDTNQAASGSESASSSSAAARSKAASAQHTEIPTADGDASQLLAGMTMSNLVDKQSQEVARTALADAGVPQESIDGFFVLVDEYNTAVPTESMVAEGFTDYGTQDPEYDVEAISKAWNDHHADYVGTNCRINTFTLADSLFSVADQDNPNDSLLFLDQQSLDNAPDQIFDEAERAKFEAFYGNVETTMEQDPGRHIADIKAYFKDRGIEFADTDARVVSVFSHDTLTEPATLFIGHTGVAVPYEDGYLFLEKLAFDMPYQAVTVKDMQQLNDYLMHKYDDGPDLEYGQPVIFDNDDVIEGMRYAKK